MGLPTSSHHRTDHPSAPHTARPADDSRFFQRRLIKFTLPLMPVALRTVPRWEVGAAALGGGAPAASLRCAWSQLL